MGETTIYHCDLCKKVIADELDAVGRRPDRGVWLEGGSFGFRDICDECQETTTIAKLRALAQRLREGPAPAPLPPVPADDWICSTHGRRKDDPEEWFCPPEAFAPPAGGKALMSEARPIAAEVAGPCIRVHFDDGSRVYMAPGPFFDSFDGTAKELVRSLHISPRGPDGGRLIGTPLLLGPDEILPLLRALLADVPADHLVGLLR